MLTLRVEGNWVTLLSVAVVVLVVLFYGMFLVVRAGVRSVLQEQASQGRHQAATSDAWLGQGRLGHGR